MRDPTQQNQREKNRIRPYLLPHPHPHPPKRIDNHSHSRLNIPMYICICKAITDKQIRRAAANGVDNLYELRQTLGVASVCGTCATTADAILKEANAAESGPTLYTPA